MDYNFAPKHKEINPDKIPKRPVEKTPDFFNMSRDELISFMDSVLSMKIDAFKIKMDSKYKERVDNVFKAGVMAMMRFIVEEHKRGNLIK